MGCVLVPVAVACSSGDDGPSVVDCDRAAQAHVAQGEPYTIEGACIDAYGDPYRDDRLAPHEHAEP